LDGAFASGTERVPALRVGRSGAVAGAAHAVSVEQAAMSESRTKRRRDMGASEGFAPVRNGRRLSQMVGTFDSSLNARRPRRYRTGARIAVSAP
jgi:hypothetical protein